MQHTEPNRYDRRDFEIMAPAGSFETLHAAIHAGADSVYFGIEGLNMRSGSAVNFSEKDLAEICRITQAAGVKSYLTLNTILYDEDMERMNEILDLVARHGVSAIIASDVAAMVEARKRGIEVHLSTQLNISNAQSLAFYAQFADVVVLARELSLPQVQAIYEQICTRPIIGPGNKLVRIEMFCHGALCMAVSGKCYLSLHELNKSANRGACGQVCRRPYLVFDKTSQIELEVEHPHIMSPKDLKTIHFVNKMMDAGVRVFKIEGRARGSEYVDATVRAYREAIESVCDGSYSPELIARWDARLAEVFNRGFWDGYYLGQRLGEWTPHYGSSATMQKVYKGRITHYFSRLGVAEVVLEAGEVAVGDEVIITGPTTGIIRQQLDEIRLDEHSCTNAPQGSTVSIPVKGKVRPGDRLYRMEQRIDLQSSFLDPKPNK